MELTEHIKSRYAERLADRDTTLDINTYVAQNEDKIQRDLDTMLEHSELVYSGNTIGYNKPVQVRRCGTWFMILDRTGNVGITIYKIELGLGEELNKTYVNAWLERLRADMERLREREAAAEEEIKAYESAIEANEKLISEYKALVKSLIEDNDAYKTIIANKRNEYSDLVLAVKKDVDAFTKRREF